MNEIKNGKPTENLPVKEAYQAPEAEIIRFEADDIRTNEDPLTTSPEDELELDLLN